MAAAAALPQVPFKAAGACDRMPHLLDQAPANFQFLGHMHPSQLPDFYRNCRIVVLTSTCFEGFPTVLAEAMLHGKPVICSRIGGLPEIVDDGATGLLFEPGNSADLAAKIDHLWNRPDLCRQFGQAGREKALREYSAEEYYERLMAVYQKAIALGAGGPRAVETMSPCPTGQPSAGRSAMIGPPTCSDSRSQGDAMLRPNVSFERHRIVGIDFDFALKDQIPEVIDQWRRIGRRSYIAIANPHSVMLCRRDPGMRRAITNAGLTLPDGVGIIIAGKLLGLGRRHRAAGPALMLELCDRGRDLGYRHFFFGGADGIADRLVQRLTNQFPGLAVAGTCCPPFRKLSVEEDEQLTARINAARPDIVWIGLGAPKQEKWMAAHVNRIHAPAMIGVGAAFDFHSGNIPWAPRWVRKYGMEWAYRLSREPRRLWRRNLDSPIFVLHVLAQAAIEHPKRAIQRLLAAPPRPQHSDPIPRPTARVTQQPVSLPYSPATLRITSSARDRRTVSAADTSSLA